MGLDDDMSHCSLKGKSSGVLGRDESAEDELPEVESWCSMRGA